MAAMRTSVVIPDQIIERVVEAPAGVTHYASFQFTDYISSDPEPFRPESQNFYYKEFGADIFTNTSMHTFYISRKLFI
jgi:hypothetical protein